MLKRLVAGAARRRGVVVAAAIAMACAGWRAMHALPVDALPDLGDTQVLVLSHWDRSPDVIEDQVTRPIVSALLGAPRVQTVRGVSEVGSSTVQVVFSDGTDPYWARARTLEYLVGAVGRLPEGVRPQLGPDATSLGWIYQYVLVDTTGKHSLAALRAVQDQYLRDELRSVPGVADVATVGGFVPQYEIAIDAARLRLHRVPLETVIDAVAGSNRDVSGGVIEVGGAEYLVRGRGQVHSAADLENIALPSMTGALLRLKDVGRVGMGAEARRGLATLDSRGDVVSGIVIMRQGENALTVIGRLQARIRELEPGLPAGVTLVPVYDRSDLVERALAGLRSTLVEIVLTIALVILVLLRHVPSAVVPILTIPLCVLTSFVLLRALGLQLDIMTLGGIALAAGTLVDAAIVMAEQTQTRLHEWHMQGRRGPARRVVLAATREVAPASAFALLVIAVSFLPVLALEGQEGRLFRPLAAAKTITILIAAALALTVDPALRVLLTPRRAFTWGPRWFHAAANRLFALPTSGGAGDAALRALGAFYERLLRSALQAKALVLGGAAALVLVTIPPWLALGTEFMPPVDEGVLFYMPSAPAGISAGQAERLLQQSTLTLHEFPEVAHVLGKAGRADTATDMAPLSMLETLVVLEPEFKWRTVHTWYSDWAPHAALPFLRRITSDRITRAQLVEEMDRALRMPGVFNAWTMPIRARLDMLASGVRTPLGLKITGRHLAEVEALAISTEAVLRGVPGTRGVYAERSDSGTFVDIDWDRARLASHGLGMRDVQMLVEGGLGGHRVTTTALGRERYGITVRYEPEQRQTVGAIQQLQVPVATGGSVPLSHLAAVRVGSGPLTLRTENGVLTSYVHVDANTRDIAGYTASADAMLRERLGATQGAALQWVGQFEVLERARARLWVLVPTTLLVVALLVYLNTGSMARTGMVFVSVPLSAVGAIWLLYLLDYQVSIAVWVGLIALIGIDAQTGTFMVLYLDLATRQARRERRLADATQLREAVILGAAGRLRPRFMTAATTLFGLVPILWATGPGADVMKRVAAPIIGGVLVSFVLQLFVVPVLYEAWQRGELVRRKRNAAPSPQTWAQ